MRVSVPFVLGLAAAFPAAILLGGAFVGLAGFAPLDLAWRHALAPLLLGLFAGVFGPAVSAAIGRSEFDVLLPLLAGLAMAVLAIAPLSEEGPADGLPHPADVAAALPSVAVALAGGIVGVRLKERLLGPGALLVLPVEGRSPPRPFLASTLVSFARMGVWLGAALLALIGHALVERWFATVDLVRLLSLLFLLPIVGGTILGGLLRAVLYHRPLAFVVSILFIWAVAAMAGSLGMYLAEGEAGPFLVLHVLLVEAFLAAAAAAHREERHFAPRAGAPAAMRAREERA